MQGQTVRIVSQAIRYIEEHLHEKMDLDMVASALHYSKYHLHRIFTKTVGLTIHDYAKRRQLTEAAKLLVFSAKPIIEIALMSGYESQQAGVSGAILFSVISRSCFAGLKTLAAMIRHIAARFPETLFRCRYTLIRLLCVAVDGADIHTLIDLFAIGNVLQGDV